MGPGIRQASINCSELSVWIISWMFISAASRREGSLYRMRVDLLNKSLRQL